MEGHLMKFRLGKPALEHKERAQDLLDPCLQADGGIEGCAVLDCFLAEGDYPGWLKNLDQQLHDPDPAYVPHETFFYGRGANCGDRQHSARPTL